MNLIPVFVLTLSHSDYNKMRNALFEHQHTERVMQSRSMEDAERVFELVRDAEIQWINTEEKGNAK